MCCLQGVFQQSPAWGCSPLCPAVIRSVPHRASICVQSIFRMFCIWEAHEECLLGRASSLRTSEALCAWPRLRDGDLSPFSLLSWCENAEKTSFPPSRSHWDQSPHGAPPGLHPWSCSQTSSGFHHPQPSPRRTPGPKPAPRSAAACGHLCFPLQEISINCSLSESRYSQSWTPPGMELLQGVGHEVHVYTEPLASFISIT